MTPKRALVQQVVVRTAVVIALAYLLLNLGIALNKNYATNRTIRSLRASIAELEQRIAYLQSKIIYLNSGSYRELEVKRRLGLKRIGEQAVLVPSNVDPQRALNRTETPPPLLTVDQTTAPTPPSFFVTARANALTWIQWIHGN